MRALKLSALPPGARALALTERSVGAGPFVDVIGKNGSSLPAGGEGVLNIAVNGSHSCAAQLLARAALLDPLSCWFVCCSCSYVQVHLVVIMSLLCPSDPRCCRQVLGVEAPQRQLGRLLQQRPRREVLLRRAHRTCRRSDGARRAVETGGAEPGVRERLQWGVLLCAGEPCGDHYVDVSGSPWLGAASSL